MSKLNTIKFILIVCILIIMILIIMILLLNKYNRNDNGLVLPEEEYKKEIINDEVVYVKKTIFYQDYKIIKNCLQIYADTLNINNSAYYGYNEENEYTKVIDEGSIKENVYSLISKDYIQKNSIRVEEIYDYINAINEEVIIIPVKITEKTENKDNVTNVKQYAISALMIPINNRQNYSYLYSILNLDLENHTFSIEPIMNKEDLEINYAISSIEENYINVFSDVKSTQEDIILDYFSDYKNILLSDIKLAYNYLDEEYKSKRFKNENKFEEYINNNKEMIENMRIEKWTSKEYSDYMQYTCINQYGGYYIFREREMLDYSVILDTYTIDLPEFIEKYNSTNEQGKVALNIQKFMQAIDGKDYKYAYNCLSEGFRNNYFKTQEEFVRYINENLYDNMDIEYIKFEEESGLFKYTINIRNLDNLDESIEKTIIMKLNEGIDFEMSFNV